MYLETGEAQRDDVFSVEAGAEVVPGSRRMWYEQTGEIVVVAPAPVRPDEDAVAVVGNSGGDVAPSGINDVEFASRQKRKIYQFSNYSGGNDPDSGQERIPLTATEREHELYHFILHAAPIELGPIDPLAVKRVLRTLAGCQDLDGADVLDRFKRAGMIGERGSTEPLVLREVRVDLPMATGVAGHKSVLNEYIPPFRHDKAACSTGSNNFVDPAYVDRFLPERGKPINHLLKQCLGCAALSPCFEYAVLTLPPTTLGIWAGMSAKERMRAVKTNGGTGKFGIKDSVVDIAQKKWEKHANALGVLPPVNVVITKRLPLESTVPTLPN